MSLRDCVETIFRRKFSFLLLFALLAAGGSALLVESRPVFQYAAEVRFRFPDNPTSPPDGVVADFVNGSPKARRTLGRSPQVIEMAARALRDRPDLFPEFDLEGDPSGAEWDRFVAHVRFSVDLPSEPEAEPMLLASAPSEEAAREIAIAASGALMQRLRGSSRVLSTELSAALAEAERQRGQARLTWSDFKKANDFDHRRETGLDETRELASLLISLRRFAAIRQESKQALRAELKKLHLAPSAATAARQNIQRINGRLAQVAARNEEMEARKTVLIASLTGWKTMEADEAALRADYDKRDAHYQAAEKKADRKPGATIDVARWVAPEKATVTRGQEVERVRSYPRLAAVLGAALLLSAGITLSRDTLSRRTAQPSEPVPAVLEHEVIARIPPAASATAALEIVQDEMVADAINGLADRLLRKRPDLKSLWISSARRWEGKTTVAVALARNLAGRGRRVLLVDASLHNPTLQQIFDFDNQYGLTTLLQGHARAAAAVEEIKSGKSKSLELSDLVVATEIENLSVLPAGPPPIDPDYRPLAADIRTSMRTAMALADIVLYDCHTLTRRSEVEKLAGVLDNLLIVLAPGESRELDIVSTNYVFQGVGRSVIGAVLNQDKKEADRRQQNKQPAPTA